MKTKLFLILKTISIIFVSIIIISCSGLGSNELKQGTYAFKKQSRLKLIYYNYIHNAGFTLGDTLRIFEDKSFTYRTCGGLRFGTFKIKNDSLYLNYDSTLVFRDNSMNYFKYSDTMTIEDENTLRMTFKAKTSKDSKETFNAITEFYYIGN
jgi:hypothetical protein